MPLDVLLNGVERQLADDPDLLVRINGHRATELRHVLPLVAAIERLGARDVIFVVTPEGE
jgi:biopolymer transport protein ExbD